MTTQADLGRPVDDLTDFLGEQELEGQEDVEDVALFLSEVEGVLGIKIEDDAFEVHYPSTARDEIEQPLLSHGFTYSGARGGGRSDTYVRYEAPV